MENNIIEISLISIFKNILNDNVTSSYISFLEALYGNEPLEKDLKLYSEFIHLLYENSKDQNIYNYIKQLIYKDENILSKGFADNSLTNSKIIDCANYELSVMDDLLANNHKTIQNILNEKFPNSKNIIEHLPIFYTNENEKYNLNDITESYKNNGFGILSCNIAFKYTKDKEIIPIKHFDPITFKDLKNYEYQQNVLKNNTKAFLEGKEANNILLYGDRGCGKSSSVKALVNEYSNENLKIIQVFKESIIYLGELFEILRNMPSKFIIFADDISFNEDDEAFSSIKAVLEGSLAHRPDNTIIYATTNRMHLVKESFSAREGNEIHYNDTIDETVSLSDRFGIMLTFSILNKNEYIDIVEKIAHDCCVAIDENLHKKALEFAALKGIRTPRVARQFIVDYIANN